jgi:hypothetical protein
MLSTIDQINLKLVVPSGYCDHPEFYWIFKNIDFKECYPADRHKVLWLSGPRRCHINLVASHIVDLGKARAPETHHLVLCCFFSTAVAAEPNSIVKVFVHTLLQQIVHNMLPSDQIFTITRFLEALLQAVLRRDPPLDQDSWRFQGVKTQSPTITNVLNASSNSDYWDTLRIILDVENEQEITLIASGLDEFEHQQSAFIEGLLSALCVYTIEPRKLKSYLQAGREQN